jgi:hypothetical protein
MCHIPSYKNRVSVSSSTTVVAVTGRTAHTDGDQFSTAVSNTYILGLIHVIRYPLVSDVIYSYIKAWISRHIGFYNKATRPCIEKLPLSRVVLLTSGSDFVGLITLMIFNTCSCLLQFSHITPTVNSGIRFLDFPFRIHYRLSRRQMSRVWRPTCPISSSLSLFTMVDDGTGS